MNEPELETLLRQYRPAQPSARLEERLALVLDSTLAFGVAAPLAVRTPTAGLLPTKRRPLWYSWVTGLGWATAGAAAGLAVALNMGSARPASAPSVNHSTATVAASTSLFEPSESAHEVLSSEDAGTLYDAENQPSRVVRYTSIERHTWLNPTTGAEVEVEVPREDMILLPASFQ